MRHSKRLTARLVTSQKPAECARDTKLKKLRLAEISKDPKVIKKQQLLLSFKHWWS
jgi:hypothetical protein